MPAMKSAWAMPAGAVDLAAAAGFVVAVDVAVALAVAVAVALRASARLAVRDAMKGA